MKLAKLIIFAVLLYLDEITVFGRFTVFNITPQLMFVFCICLAAKEDRWSVVDSAAIAAGVLLDLQSSAAFGTNTVVFVFSATVAYLLGAQIFTKLIFALASCFVLTLLGQSAFYLINYSQIGSGYGSVLWAIILPMAAVNTLFCLGVFPIVSKLCVKKKIY